VKLDGVEILNNRAAAHGAGAYIDHALANFTNCTIKNNTNANTNTSKPSAGGGAFVSRSATVHYVGCSIVRNCAGDGSNGGGVESNGEDTFNNSTLVHSNLPNDCQGDQWDFGLLPPACGREFTPPSPPPSPPSPPPPSSPETMLALIYLGAVLATIGIFVYRRSGRTACRKHASGRLRKQSATTSVDLRSPSWSLFGTPETGEDHDQAPLTASLLAVEQSTANARERARAQAWLLLTLATLSISPAGLFIVIGATYTLRKLQRPPAEQRLSADLEELSEELRMARALASAKLWYAPAAVCALVTFGFGTFWFLQSVLVGPITFGFGTLDGFIFFWMLLCSPVLILGSIWAVLQPPPVTAAGDRRSPLRAKRLLSAEQVQCFAAACTKVERLNEELFAGEQGAFALSRFTADSGELIIGRPDEALRGLESCMGVREDYVRRKMLDGTAAIVAEVEALGVPELTLALHELALCKAPQGDAGGLDELVKHERSVLAGLQEAHVVAIRLYTCSAGFAHFNSPMRDVGELKAAKPHPLPVSMAFLADGIRKLRRLYEREHRSLQSTASATGGAASPSTPSCSSEVILYRGCHNLTLSDAFLADCAGGTERAVCSTTSSFDVAVDFMLRSPSGLSVLPKEVLLMRLVVRNCNRSGGAIHHLSVNPAENEVLFPPLTYLEPNGNYQIEQIGGTRLIVVDVIPV